MFDGPLHKCVVHGAALLVKDVVKAVREVHKMADMAARLVNSVRHTSAVHEALEKKLEAMSPTRFFTVYYLLRSVHDNFARLVELRANGKLPPAAAAALPYLSGEGIGGAPVPCTAMVIFLNTFRNLIVMLPRLSSPDSVHLVVPYLKLLRKEYAGMLRESSAPSVKHDLLTVTVARFAVRFDHLIADSTYLLSAYLDKHDVVAFSEEERATFMPLLRQHFHKAFSANMDTPLDKLPSVRVIESAVARAEARAVGDNPYAILERDQPVVGGLGVNVPIATEDDEFAREHQHFVHLPKLAVTCIDPLEAFRGDPALERMPHFVEVARMVFKVTPSCIDVDRLFSLGGRVKTALRNRMGDDMFEALLLTQSNAKMCAALGIDVDSVVL